MRPKFDEQLMRLDSMLIEMGALIETSISTAINALVKKDVDLAKKAISIDAEIDQQEKDIETLCLKLLLKQQPVAHDLRLISAALKMITDMERIGDQAADIGEITLQLTDQSYITKLVHIPQMAEVTIKMVTESIDAFVKKDLTLASSVIAQDDIVDDLFITVRNDLLDVIQKDPQSGKQALDLLMIAKYLERIGDHAVNITEWVVFSITGEHKSHQ
ncbi:MAG: phosphate signaling complex protein PhoU [Spirochaetales bacterium]